MGPRHPHKPDRALIAWLRNVTVVKDKKAVENLLKKAAMPSKVQRTIVDDLFLDRHAPWMASIINPIRE